MWKQLVTLLQNLLTLAKDLEQTRNDIKEIRQDLTKLTHAVQYLSNEIKLIKQEDMNEREKMAMQLQIEILKFEKRLPPAPSSEMKKKKGKQQT